MEQEDGPGDTMEQEDIVNQCTTYVEDLCSVIEKL